MIDRTSPELAAPDGAAPTWVGVDSWSRAGGPRMPYRARGLRVGAERAVASDLLEALVDRLLHRDGACYVRAVDTGDGPRSPRIELCGGGWLQDVESGERVEAEVGLPPYGVRVFRWVTS